MAGICSRDLLYEHTRWFFHIFRCGKYALAKTHCFKRWWLCSSRTLSMCDCCVTVTAVLTPCPRSTLAPHLCPRPGAPGPPSASGNLAPQGPPVLWARAGFVPWPAYSPEDSLAQAHGGTTCVRSPFLPSRAGQHSTLDRARLAYPSLVDGHVDGVRLLAAVNHGAMNIADQAPLHSLWGHTQKWNCWATWKFNFLIFLGNPRVRRLR